MTTGIHIIIGCCLLPAAAVFVASRRTPKPSAKQAISFFVALGLLGISTEISIWSAFVAAGGPDGRFLHQETILLSTIGTIAGLALAATAVHLLSLPQVFTMLYPLPVLVTIIGLLLGSWPIALAAFAIGPIIWLGFVIGTWIKIHWARPKV